MNDDLIELPELPEVTRLDLEQTMIALAVILVALVFAWLVATLSGWIVRHITSQPDQSLDEALIPAIRAPLAWLIALQGIFAALRIPSYLDPYDGLITRLWAAAFVLIVVIAVRRVATSWFFWYQVRTEAVEGARVDPRTLPMLRRATSAIIVVLGGLLLLDVIGLEVTPLIAGLGIGGLAVALALQPVLGNIFASSYMLSDASLRVGDFVEVENGPVGVVEAIGWRATRIKSFDNNIVLVPNSTLVSSTFTNYSATDLQADARATFGVAYEEDLNHVEEVVVDELTRLRDEFEESVKDYEPMVRFQNFGDSNIDVLMKLRALTWGDSFMLRHLMMKRIHDRLRREGIVINYPARRLMLQHEDVEGLDRLLRRPADGAPAAPRDANGAGSDAASR